MDKSTSNYVTSPRLRLLLTGLLVFTLSGIINSQEVPQVITLEHPSKNFEHHCWSITEDCNGYLYTATAAGVSVYNGFGWYTAPLPYNRIPRCLYLGTDCRVYVGGFETFGYIDLDQNKEPVYVAVGDSVLRGSNEEMWRIMGHGARVMVQSFSQVYEYAFSTLINRPIDNNIRLGAVVRGEFYYPDVFGNIYRISGETTHSIQTALPGDEPIRISAMAPTSSINTVLVCTERKGIFTLANDILTPLVSPALDTIASQQINEITHLSSGAYAIGTVLNGLYITNDLTTISHHINKLNGLSSNTVISMHEDAYGNLWVGTDGGLNVIRLGSDVMCYYDNEGLLGSVYSTLMFEGEMYMSTSHGVFRRNMSGDVELLPNSQGQAWSLMTYGEELLCGHNNGTYSYDGSSIELISDITGGWWMEFISPSTILQSTYTGLVILKHDGDRWYNARLRGGNVLMRKFVRAGVNLLGYHSRYGLCVATLSSSMDRVINTHYINEINGSPVDPAVGMFSNDTDAFVKWNDQLYIVKDTSLEPIDAQSHSINKLLKSNLAAYDNLMASGESFAVSTLDHNALSSIDKFIFSREYGYEVTGGTQVPDVTPVEIDHVVIKGKRESPSALNDLGPGQQNILIQLRKLGDLTQDANLSYLLEPSDDTWLRIPSNGSLSFQNLASGDYILHIEDGFGNRKELTSFKVPSPWHLSWPGSILYVSIVLVVFLLWNKRVERRTTEKARFKHEEEVRQLEAQQIRYNNEQLQRELQLKSKLLANRAMSLAQKNKLLLQLKNLAQSQKAAEADPAKLRSRIIRMVDQHTDHEDEWKVFESNFDEVHEQFTDRLLEAHPNLTSGDKRLASFIRMDLSSKEIAPLLRISVRSVENKRHRLRKKMDLKFGDSLSEYLMRL